MTDRLHRHHEIVEAHRLDHITVRIEVIRLEDVFVRITGIEAETMRKEKEKTGGAV